MSDKSKLGFNINPKSYDELNSTDNLITSGSDSGWLGKKLQGDDSNDLDLSKINPIFDKELYEKYRPGVNTNDGSVNQDIWGFKCFNSPVSFRNGIYGDTYSITENKSSDEPILVLRIAHGNYEGRISIAGSSMTMTTGQEADSDPYIEINGDDNSIVLHAEKLNLPPVTVTHALSADNAQFAYNAEFANRARILSQNADSVNYIEVTDNSLVPVGRSVSLGGITAKFDCVYAHVFDGIARSATALAYSEGDMAAILLTADSENVILPTGNKEISIGNNDHRLGTIYADSFNGKATSADTADTARKAIHDYYGNDIRCTYVIKNLNTSNDIQSYNAIIGSGERLFFFNEPCIENSIESPEDIPKPYVSIGTTYENDGVTSKNVFSWTNKNNTITQKCTISSRFTYDEGGQYGATNFYVYPEASSNNLFSSHIGKSNSPWDYIYCNTLNCNTLICNRFPTIHETLGSNDAGPGPGTAVGNIRLLCIKAPTVSKTLIRTIEPGEEFEYPVILSDNAQFNAYSVECTVHIAIFKVTDNSNRSIGIEAGAQVAGKWVALSSTYIKASIADISPCFPILAMRVE